MTRIFAFSLAFCIALVPTLASADDAKDRAKALFLQGREHYVAGRFADALDAFEQANAVKPHPVMLFNIAQVYEAIDDLPHALARYDEYLASKPGDAKEVQAKVKALNERMATWAEVTVDSTPPGATVWVASLDLPPRGQTPIVLRLPPVQLTLIFQLDRHERVERSVALQAKQKVSLAVAMPPILPVVEVTTEPAGARVSVGDSAAPGVTPLRFGAQSGRQRLRIELEGFEPVDREVVLDETHTQSQPLRVDVQLDRAIPRGQLVIVVDPAGASVKVDGQVVGTAPLAGPLTLKQGLHRIEVTAPGTLPYSEMVSIQPNATTETEVELDVPGKPTDLKTVSWIVMGVGGAAVVGGGIAAILASSAHGDFEDCGGDAGCARTQEEVDLADDVRSKALATDVLLGVGVGIAAAGAALYFLSGDDAPSASGGATLVVAPASGGLMGVGRFEF